MISFLFCLRQRAERPAAVLGAQVDVITGAVEPEPDFLAARLPSMSSANTIRLRRAIAGIRFL
jgi:hypothetical protein